MNSVPVPRDIPLPLPASGPFLEVLLIVAFIAHILFVNLMVGASLLVFAFEVRGLKRPGFDDLAHELAKTITVNKSLAVVLGVAPLLVINVLYTIHFYTANALTGTAWILLVPAIAAAFLLLYAHKYSWARLASHKAVHLTILGLAVLLFLAIPLVFLGNVSLMMFPERWTEVRGFLGTLTLPGVLPRYLHFLCASLILASLFGVGYFGRASYPADARLPSLSRAEVRKAFYSIAFAVSLAQFLAGPLVMVSLPSKGYRGFVILSFASGVALAIPAVWLMWKELTATSPAPGRFVTIVSLLSATVVFMAVGRHTYRGVTLAGHRAAIKEATEQWARDSAQAAYEAEHHIHAPAGGETAGRKLFQNTCGACHGVDRRVVGPPLTEIAQIYAGRPEGIVAWARAPGKRRPDYPQMPSMASVGDGSLLEIAQFMLRSGAQAN
jgi:cytochrome c